MSTSTTTPTAPPISPSRFALALRDLPLENLYSKAHELENSITHLQRSNTQLQTYSDSIKQDTTIDGTTREEVGDKECLEAIRENEVVIERQKERVGLVKREVERRGRVWHDGEEGRNGDEGGGGVERERERQRLSDEELRRRMEERMGGAEEDGEDGMHL